MFLKVANFFLPYLCSVFLLLGRKPVARVLHQLCKVLFTKLCKVLLPISSQVVHKYILRDFGECCESVPLDCPGSYVSISIKYICCAQTWNLPNLKIGQAKLGIPSLGTNLKIGQAKLGISHVAQS